MVVPSSNCNSAAAGREKAWPCRMTSTNLFSSDPAGLGGRPIAFLILAIACLETVCVVPAASSYFPSTPHGSVFIASILHQRIRHGPKQHAVLDVPLRKV